MKAGLLIAIVAVVAARADGGWVAGAFPDRLERYLTDAVKLNAGQQRTLLAGGPITTLLDGDASREVGVFGAVWIDAPVGRYVDAVTDIESFERGGGFQITRRISDP